MPFLLILLLLLPFIDIYLMGKWLWESTAFALTYLAVTVLLGGFMIKLAKIGVGEAFRLMQSNRASPLLIIRFARIWFSGALLLFPGYMSDALALLVLLFPGGRRQVEDDERGDNERPLEVEAEEIEADKQRYD